MIRDITLGQYYPADSILHKLDPRVKLVATLSFLVALFLIDSWIGYVVATVFLAAVIRLSKVPFRFIVRGLKTIFIILMITLVFNLFLTPGDRVQFTDAEDSVYLYQVEKTELLSPTAVEEMTAEEWDLTLFTCDFSGKARIAVRCQKDPTNG